MPSTDAKLLKLVKGKLVRLLNCVMAKAADDEVFAQELVNILRTDERGVGVEKKSMTEKQKGFNPVGCLHEYGESRLRSELCQMTDDQLRDLIREQGIAKGKEVRTLLRDKMIEDIVQFADRRLHQGTSFLS